MPFFYENTFENFNPRGGSECSVPNLRVDREQYQFVVDDLERNSKKSKY